MKESAGAFRGDIRVFARGAGLGVIGKVGGRAINLIANILLARMLGVNSFGLVAIGITLVQYGELLGKLGLQNAVIRFGTTAWRGVTGPFKDLIVTSDRLALMSGGFVGGVLFLASPLLANALFHDPNLVPVLRIAAFAIPLLAFSRLTASVTRLSQDMKYSILAEDFIQPAAFILFLGLTAVFTPLSAGNVMVAYALSILTFLATACYFLFRLKPDLFSSKVVPAFKATTLLQYALPTLAGTMFVTVTLTIDRLILGIIQNSGDVGVYQAMSQTANMLVILQSGFGLIFFPMFAHLIEAQNFDRLQTLFQVATKWTIYFCLPFFLLLLLLPEPVLVVIYGSSYASSPLPLVILSIGQFVNISTGAVGFILILGGYERDWMRISGIGALSAICLNLIFVPFLGMLGASLATSLSVALLYGFALFRVRRKMGLWPYDLRYLKGLLAAFLTILLYFIIPIPPPWPRLILVACKGIILALGFWGTLALVGLDSEDKELVSLIITRIQKTLKR